MAALALVIGVLAWMAIDPRAPETPPASSSATASAPSSPDHQQTDNVDPPVALAPPVSASHSQPSSPPYTGPGLAELHVLLLNQGLPPSLSPPLTITLKALSDEVLLTRESKRSIGSESEVVIASLDPGKYSVAVAIPGLSGASKEVQLVAGRNECVFDLTTVHAIRGRIIDQHGTPVTGADVALSTALSGGAPRTLVTAKTASDGTYDIPLLSGDLIYDLTALALGYRPESISMIVLDHPGPHVLKDITLHQSSPLAGVVQLEDGRPVPSCTVQSRFGAWSGETITDEHGGFAFPSIPDGQGVVWTESATLVNTHTVVSTPMEREFVRLVVGKGAYLEGTAAFDDGSPVTGLLLWGFPAQAGDGPLVPRFEAYRRTTLLSEVDGHFRLGPFPPGEVEVLELARSSFSGTFRTDQPAHIVFQRPMEWRIEIRFVDQASGQTLACSGQYDMQWGGGGVKAIPFEADGTGYFEIVRRVPSGAQIDITLAASGFESIRLEDVRSRVGSDAVTSVALRPQQPLGIEVVTKSETKSAIPNATVKIVWPFDGSAHLADSSSPDVQTEGRIWFPGTGSHSLTGVTDSQGKLRLAAPSRSTLLFAVIAQGYYPLLGELQRSNDTDKYTRIALERIHGE